jgi:cell wall-associated NlpC family hydrolase
MTGRRAIDGRHRERGRLTALTLAAATLSLAVGCAPKRVGYHPLEPPPATAAATRPQIATPAKTPRSTPPRAAAAGARLDTTLTPPPGSTGMIPKPRPRPRSGSDASSLAVADDLGRAAAELALAQRGKAYAYGAAGPSRFDCSGLVHYVYRRVGVALPRVARQQARAGRSVGLAEARPGDLLCFAVNGGAVDHIGVFVGGTRFVHAPRRGRPVGVDSIADSYWRRRLRDVRRIDTAQAVVSSGER